MFLQLYIYMYYMNAGEHFSFFNYSRPLINETTVRRTKSFRVLKSIRRTRFICSSDVSPGNIKQEQTRFLGNVCLSSTEPPVVVVIVESYPQDYRSFCEKKSPFFHSNSSVQRKLLPAVCFALQ